MTHDDFLAILGRLARSAERRAEAARRGAYLSEVSADEQRDRSLVRQYCRSRGLPVPVHLELGSFGSG